MAEKVDSTVTESFNHKEMILPIDLNKDIVKFLNDLPNMMDKKAWQALIQSAGLDAELQNQIDYPESARQFFDLLIPTLLKYELLKDGRNPIEAVLEAAKSYVGSPKKKICENLIQRVRNILNAGKPEPPPPKPGPLQEAYLYYLASTKGSEFTKRFPIMTDSSFKRTKAYDEAEIYIFDIDHPPDDWPKYLGGEKKFRTSEGKTIKLHDDVLQRIIFIASAEVNQSMDKPVSGECIWNIIRNAYGFSAPVCREEKDFSTVLSRVKSFINFGRVLLSQASIELTLAECRGQ